MDWDALMVAAQAGDAIAYRRLLTEISVWLKRYYSRRLPSSMVDDVSQEVLLALHAKRHTYDPERPFMTWLAAIARYKWIDSIRSLQSNATVPLDDELAVPSDESTVTSAWSLERLLGTLKPAQAEVIRLVKLEGLQCRGGLPGDRAIDFTREGQYSSRIEAADRVSRGDP